MGLHENLVDAEAAILFVRKICGIRADNYDQPEFLGEAAAPGKVGASHADSGRLLDELSSAMLARYDAIHGREYVGAEAKLLKSDRDWKDVRDTIDALNRKKEAVPKELIAANMRLNAENRAARAKVEELKRERERAMANKGESIRQKALAAIHHKAGNCEAQAAIAFNFLQQKGVHPIDYYYAAGGDHQWIVIGRAKGSAADNPDVWGAAAVICDPWDKKCYAATEFDVKMHQLGQAGIPTSEFRIE